MTNGAIIVVTVMACIVAVNVWTLWLGVRCLRIALRHEQCAEFRSVGVFFDRPAQAFLGFVLRGRYKELPLESGERRTFDLYRYSAIAIYSFFVTVPLWVLIEGLIGTQGSGN